MLTDTKLLLYLGVMDKQIKNGTSALGAEKPKLQPVTESDVAKWLDKDLETAIAMLAMIKNNPDIMAMVAAFAAGKHNNLVNQQLQNQDN